MNNLLPGARAPIAGQFQVSPPFYQFFRSLAETANSSSADVSAVQADIKKIASDLGSPDGSVANIPPFTTGTPTLKVLAPLTFAGLLQSGFMQIGWGGTTSDVPEGSRRYFKLGRAWAFG